MSLFRSGPVRQQVRGIFGAAATGITRGIERHSERQRQQRAQQLQERLRETQERRLSLEEQEFEQSRRQQETFNKTLRDIVEGPRRREAMQEAERSKQRAGGLKIMKDLADLSQMPKSVRGPQVDAFAARFAQNTGHPMAANVVETLKKGSTDDLRLLSRGLARMVTQNQRFNAQEAVETLSNPGKSATLFTQAGKMAPVLEEQDRMAERGGEVASQQRPGATGGQGQRQQGQQGQRQGQARGQQRAGDSPRQVRQLNQTVERLRRLAGTPGLTSAQRRQVDFQIEQIESRRNDTLRREEANTLRGIQNMPDEQALSRLQRFEARLLESNAPQSQINRVQDRMERLRPDEDDQGRLSFTSTFRRVAAGLFGPNAVRNEQGQFDGSRLSREQIQQVNQRIEEVGLEKERAGALASQRAEASALARKRADEQFSTQNLIGELAGSPEGAVGVRRALGNLAGSTVGQVPGLQGFANSLTEFFTGGLDQEQLSALNTQFRSIVGQVAETFTGDEGGRLSNQDLERVDRAIPAQKTFTTKDQVMGSLKELASLQELALWKQRFRAGDGLDFDPNTKDSVKAKVREYMRRFEMTAEQAGGLVSDVITINDIHGGP